MNPKFQRIISKIDKLPTLPIAATKIVQLVNNPNTNAKDINGIISADQSLASKVLKLVNSAYYGLSNKVSSITQSVVILGFNTIKSLALSASVLDTFSSDESTDFNRTEFWKHSLGVGVGAKLIAYHIKIPQKQQEDFFICGLLHDMGKVILDQYMHDEFKEVLETVKLTGSSFYKAEQEILGITHAEIGRKLAEKWNLPANIQESIRYHHTPSSAKDFFQIAAVVHFADILCKSKSIGFSGDSDINMVDEESIEKLNIPPQILEKIINEEMDREFEKATVFLSV